MLLPWLIALNIPVYLFIGWLAFDSKSNAADTFVGTLVAIVKRVTVPRIILVLIDADDADEAWGIFPILAFFGACAGIVYGEFYLIQKYFH
jgi:hypothetical protein